MARVLVLVADGSEEIETVAMIDVLRRGQLEVVVAGLDGLTVTGSRGIVIQADCRLDQLTDAQLDEFDWLYLPGGLKGAQTFAAQTGVRQLLASFAGRGRQIAAICAAPLALAAAGLLAGRRYTCYPGIEQQISDGEWQDRLVVSDGPIWTGQGPAATIDLALSVIAAACGRDRAREVAQGLLWHKLAAGSRGDD